MIRSRIARRISVDTSGLLAALLIALAASGAAGETLVERGGYLVNGIMTCDHCHTPKDTDEDLNALVAWMRSLPPLE